MQALIGGFVLPTNLDSFSPSNLERNTLSASPAQLMRGAPAPAVEPPSPVRQRVLAGWWPVLAAATGGALNAAAFPGVGWWPLVFVGTPLILASLTAHRLPIALVVGAVAGAVFWGTHTFWLTVYLGPVPWLALTGLETVFFAAGCALATLAWRATDVAGGPGWVRFGVTPLVVGGLWTVREYVTSTWPYGGFSWGRLAFSQSESPFGELAAWVGVSGVSFLIAAFSALVVQVLRASTGTTRTVRILPAAVLVTLMAIPPFPVTETGTLRVGAAQGNSDAGLLAQNGPGRILEDHLAATEPILDEEMDLLVWPENASDLNPLTNRAAADALNEIAARVNAPMVVGTLTDDGSETFNSLLLWQPGVGDTGQYDKKHPVPFAEYLPDRDFWYPLAPELFSLIPRDFSIGTRDNVFDLNGVTAGLAICFDIVDETLIREMVSSGAELILAPTNNADFGRTDQSAQQLAIARLRAIEAGRSVVNISTVATSAMIAPDGSTIDRLPTFEAGAMVQNVPLSSTVTPAMAFGPALEGAAMALGIGGLAIAGLGVARKRRRRDESDHPR